MKRFLSLVVALSLLLIPSTNAAPKKISVKALKLVTTISSNNNEDVAGFVISGTAIIIFGTSVDRSFVRAVDLNGQELWSIALDPNSPSIASAGAVDSAGNIWIAGSTSLLRSKPAATSTPLNPDNVVTSPDIFTPELNAVALWKIPAGTSIPTLFSAQQSAPVLITAIAVDGNGLSLVGLIQSAKGSSGFVIGASPSGEFTQPALVGSISTTLDAVVRHSDGTLTVTGASTETLGGKKLVGVIDGIIVKISKTNSVLKVVRSSASHAQRNWSSATSKLLLGGTVITGSKVESAVTKFSNLYSPTWTYRFLSSGPTFTLGSTYALFFSTGTIAQLDNWRAKKPQPILLAFDTKGVINGAFSAPVDQREIVGLASSKALGLLCLMRNSELMSIFTLP